MKDFVYTSEEERLAKMMALEVNGGDWKKDYTQAQKNGWILKVRWAVDNIQYLSPNTDRF